MIFTLLTVTLAAVAQPRISSNKETHNFGQIEWKKPVTVEYTITNPGNEPLVLTNVTTSCACAVADWTKEPIAPGAKGTVKASFDAKALGRFDKSIGIYSNATPNLVYLKFTGEVVQEIKDYSKLLPYAIGNIRIDRDEFSFPDVYRGQQPSMTFSIANLSDRPYEPVLMHLPPYLKMEAEPKVLLKGKKGTIKLTLDASQLQDFGLTQTSVYLSRFSGDKVSEDNEIPVSAILLPDFSRMTEKDSLNAPSIHISGIRQTPAYQSAAAKQAQREPEKKPFTLPWARRCATAAVSYLQRRGISSDVISRCFRNGLFYEARYHGEPVCVFVGKDNAGKAKFACMRGITGNLKKDVYGSDKEFSFCYPPQNPGSRHVAVFEAPIDALSHATLQELEGWKWNGYRLSLGGTSHVALTAFLERHPEIKRVTLYMDNDLGGLTNARKIKAMLHEDQRFKHIRVSVNPPRVGKDYNEKLQHIREQIKGRQLQCRQKQAAISI